jgi:four helix bundle protein
MSVIAEELKIRTKRFAVTVITFCRTLPKDEEFTIIKKQLIRSATSTVANYRAVCRARSDAEFFSKLSIVVEEADETLFLVRTC